MEDHFSGNQKVETRATWDPTCVCVRVLFVSRVIFLRGGAVCFVFFSFFLFLAGGAWGGVRFLWPTIPFDWTRDSFLVSRIRRPGWTGPS